MCADNSPQVTPRVWAIPVATAAEIAAGYSPTAVQESASGAGVEIFEVSATVRTLLDQDESTFE